MSGAGGLLAWALAAAGPFVALAALRQGLARATAALVQMLAVYGVTVGIVALSLAPGARPSAGFVLASGAMAGAVAVALFLFGRHVGGRR